MNQNKLWEELALRPIQIIYIMHIICSVVWFELSKSDPIPPCDKKHGSEHHTLFFTCARESGHETALRQNRHAEKACKWIYMVLVVISRFSYSPFQPVSSATVTNGKNLATTMSFVQSTKEDSPA